MHKKVSTLKELDAEILRLRRKCHELENRLDHNVEDLRENFGTMAFNSTLGGVFGRRRPSAREAYNMGFMGQNRMEKTALLLMGFLGNRIADWVEDWISKKRKS